MDFVRTTSWEDGVAKLAETIVTQLSEGRHVLWLVCGGSNIPAAVQVMNSIATDLSSRLTVTLTDERYGPVGHKDSNWQQLLDAGFAPKQARALPVLQDGLDLQATAARYDTLLQDAFKAAGSVIGQFGIGEDGHIAGILPGSAATTATELATGYETTPFKRLTMTFAAFRHLHTAYAFAFGSGKHDALAKLHDQTLSPAEQPAQILRQVPETHIYNDQIGG